ERTVRLREAAAHAGRSEARRRDRGARPRLAAAAAALDAAAQARFEALKAWRAGVAREHNLPAYVIFHDATLAAIAERRPRQLDALAQISGMGTAKLEKYGAAVLAVCAGPDDVPGDTDADPGQR
ncbi:HRDC domain-containing protein, partial [Tibeticola sp.]|uniref:HRDC domain-containing protein n=1 Tax=Tibeticola sp. TaxID=2005368 RepID=UPI0025D24D07